MRQDVTVIGAGPAGLTAAYELSRHGITGTIIEASDSVGGISRTVLRNGYRFDLGGHRFFTKVPEIEHLWDEMLGEPLLVRNRQSRIFFDGRFFDYPLRPANAMRNLGITKAARCVLSYAAARLYPAESPATYEAWIVNQFGRELFNTFFKSYTEKVWGIPCGQISADWAAQRVKGLNLGEAMRNAIFGTHKTRVVTSLVDRFRYPRLGPGQLWERCAELVQARGWDLRLTTAVVGASLQGGRVRSLTLRHADGKLSELATSQVVSSMPVRDLVRSLRNGTPPSVTEAAEQLRYRDFMTVSLVLDVPDLFSDNWIYIHSPDVRMGRIQNFKNWSPALVADPQTTCIGLEYFVQEGDATWNSPDARLIEMGHRELTQIGLARGRLIAGYVVRVSKAYPVYDVAYSSQLQPVTAWLKGIANLQCIGRNGQHRYNNQDHSMATALIAARNLLNDEWRDPWAVNQDAEYHERRSS